MAERNGISSSIPADIRNASPTSPARQAAGSSCAVWAEENERFAAKLAAGDERVLGEILRQFGPAVRGLLARKYRGVLGDGDFEDVLSIALFRIWQHRQEFDPNRASLKVWFYRIATNAARDVLRYGWHKVRTLEVSFDASLELSPDSNESDDSESSCREDEELSELLSEILATLPETQRRIVLADAASREGKVPSRKLSDELGIPADTVRVYRRRAIARLRKEADRRGLRWESDHE